MFYDSNHAQHASRTSDDRPHQHVARALARCGARRRVRTRGKLPLKPLKPFAPWEPLTPMRACARRQPAGALLRSVMLAWAVGAAFCAAGGAAAQSSGAVASVALERSVKAAFLYKFLGYTEFPAGSFSDAAAPLAIGVIGADDLAAELQRIVAGRTVLARPVIVKTFREGDTPAGVHMLFIGGSDAARVRSVLRAVKDAPMLSVTEADNGLLYGSVINFKIVEERVRFDVSLEAADKNSVKLSSRLLTVANHVQKGTP
jgi:hypothetical protein